MQQIVKARPASDGCDLAGAIPDCKAVMAKLIVEQALHPPEYHGLKPGDERKSGGASRQLTDDALTYAMARCRSEYDGPSQATQELRGACIASAEVAANDAMSKR
jgi:hypothetical protein